MHLYPHNIYSKLFDLSVIVCRKIKYMTQTLCAGVLRVYNIGEWVHQM